MCGRFALYGPVKLRRELKQDDFEWLDTLVERIAELTQGFNFTDSGSADRAHARFHSIGRFAMPIERT